MNQTGGMNGIGNGGKSNTKKKTKKKSKGMLYSVIAKTPV